MDRQTNKIKEIFIKGYDDTNKKYKFLLVLDEGDEKSSEMKVQLKWDRVQKGLKNIRKDINKNVYAKLMFDLELNVVVKDPKYNSLAKFIDGIPTKKNNRKITDVQNLFNRILHNRYGDDSSNQMAVLSMFDKTFGIIN
jgi:hypothetical protein